MGLIELKGMEFYAYHGHFKEEQVVGNHFLIDLIIKTNTKTAEISDNLLDALDYQKVYGIINAEMQIKSFLLENISFRIKEALLKTFPQIETLELKVSKINPPLGGRIEKVSIILTHE